MGRPLKPAAVAERKPFFGEWPPLVGSLLLFALGLAAVSTFYASVFAAAHVIAVENGGSREQLGRVSLWVCALFVVQGLVPLVRFSVRDLPGLLTGNVMPRALNVGLFVLLFIGGTLLLLS